MSLGRRVREKQEAVLAHFWCSCEGGQGNRRALSSSTPAHPYICLFSIFNRLMWPSVGPLLHTCLTAFSTALQSFFRRRTKRLIGAIPAAFACLTQPRKLETVPWHRMLRNSATGDASWKIPESA